MDPKPTFRVRTPSGWQGATTALLTATSDCLSLAVSATPAVAGLGFASKAPVDYDGNNLCVGRS
jgi:hypothetical protein